MLTIKKGETGAELCQAQFKLYLVSHRKAKNLRMSILDPNIYLIGKLKYPHGSIRKCATLCTHVPTNKPFFVKTLLL